MFPDERVRIMTRRKKLIAIVYRPAAKCIQFFFLGHLIAVFSKDVLESRINHFLCIENRAVGVKNYCLYIFVHGCANCSKQKMLYSSVMRKLLIIAADQERLGAPEGAHQWKPAH